MTYSAAPVLPAGVGGGVDKPSPDPPTRPTSSSWPDRATPASTALSPMTVIRPVITASIKPDAIHRLRGGLAPLQACQGPDLQILRPDHNPALTHPDRGRRPKYAQFLSHDSILSKALHPTHVSVAHNQWPKFCSLPQTQHYSTSINLMLKYCYGTISCNPRHFCCLAPRRQRGERNIRTLTKTLPFKCILRTFRRQRRGIFSMWAMEQYRKVAQAINFKRSRGTFTSHV